MKPFSAVRKEIKSYPRQQFTGGIKFNWLSMEITRKCNSACRHCANYGSPLDNRTMDKRVVFRLIKEAKEQKIRSVHLWGGEPFEHPKLNRIMKKVFRNNLQLLLTSNGFWGATKEAALQKLAKLQRIKPDKLSLYLILSCDAFHLSQPNTPVQNIANILTAARKMNDKKIGMVVNSLNLKSDNSLEKLFALLPPRLALSVKQWNRLKEVEKLVVVDDEGMNMTMVFIENSLDVTVGRAKTLNPAIRVSQPLSRDKVFGNSQPAFGYKLYVGVEGDVFIDYLHVGDKIFPIGSIKTTALGKVVEDAGNDPMVWMLSRMPIQYLLLPFRKYLDLDKIMQQSYSINELFNRLYLMKEEEYDKTKELARARKRLIRRNLTGTGLKKVLGVIRDYGDITDGKRLKGIFMDQHRRLNDRWEAAFVFNVLRPDAGDYFVLIHDKGGHILGNRGNFVAGMGIRKMPQWVLDFLGIK